MATRTNEKAIETTTAGFKVPSEFDYQTRDLDGQRVLVTGGTTGIGRAITLLLADQGARVLTYGRHQKELDEALEDLQQNGRDVHGFTADQSSLDGIRKIFEQVDDQLGGLDILINNASLGAEGVQQHDLEEIQYVLNTNLLAYVACCKEALARMKKRGGHVVLIGSLSAETREGDSSVYVAAKSGVQGFAESFRKEAKELGVRVTLIEPGAVGTDMQPKKSTHARKAEQKTMLKAEDLAACVHFCVTQPDRADVSELRIWPLKQ